ncbi:MAG: DMT family transporter [Hyphomicrobiaceae bacterium]
MSEPALPPTSKDSPLTGIVMMLTAMAILPVTDAAAKYMTVAIPALQLVWARYVFQMLTLLPVGVAKLGTGVFRSNNLRLQLARSLILTIGTVFFFAALQTMPLADALAVFFLSPILTTMFSPLVLGEHVGPWRWSAVILGFAGALLVIRPGFQTFTPGLVFAIGSGFTYAGYALITRKLAGTDHPLVTLNMTGLVGAGAASLILPFVWVMPTAEQWGLMLLMGVVSAFGHMLIILAYERSSASGLAPFAYAEIVSAAALGYWLFGDFPSAVTWTGILTIVTSGIVIAWREGVRRRRG